MSESLNPPWPRRSKHAFARTVSKFRNYPAAGIASAPRAPVLKFWDASGLGWDQAVAVRRCRRDEGLLLGWLDDLIDQAIVLRHLRGHKEVPLDVALDLLRRPAGVLCVDADDDLPQSENLACVDLDIRRLGGPHAATRLVQHDLAMRQRQPLALRSTDQDQ